MVLHDIAQQTIWRYDGLFDAIVCDPPYGIRAGAKKIGRKRKLDKYLVDPQEEGFQPYIPSKLQYGMKGFVFIVILVVIVSLLFLLFFE